MRAFVSANLCECVCTHGNRFALYQCILIGLYNDDRLSLLANRCIVTLVVLYRYQL